MPLPQEDPLNRRIVLASLLALTPLAAGRARAAQAPASPLPEGALSEGVVKKTLSNGLTLIVKPLHSAPVVAVNAWVKVGSVQESGPERGITHFIEHMLFKGTESLKVGELDKLIKRNGGYNNAHTRYESTDFIDVMPADKLAVALGSMADALQHSTFDAGELDRERKVVLEELSRSQDNPSFEAWNRLCHLAFTTHPYQYPIIGYKPVIEGMDRALLVGYWKRWYRPQNVAVVIAGDVDPQAAVAAAEAAFGGWTAGKDSPKRLPAEPAQDGLRCDEAGGDIQTTLLVMGVPGVAELDPDGPALDMALSILGQGLSSRLNLEVREKQKLVHSVVAGQFNGADPGLAYLWAELEPSQVKPAAQALWAQVLRMQAEPVAAEEIERQKLRLEHDDAADRMSMEGLAGKLGYYEALGGDYRLVDELTERMKAVSAADIQRVMRKYFLIPKLNVVLYRPKAAPPTGLDAKGWAALLKAVPVPADAAPAGVALGGGLTRFTLSSGATLIVKSVRHTPLVAGQLLFPSGQLLEPASQSGALNLLARLLFKGLPGADAAAVAAQMDDLGLALGAQADADRFSLSFQALASKSADSMALMGRVIRDAQLPQAELDAERKRVLKDIKDKGDSAEDVLGDEYAAAFFGPGHPYGRPLEGVPATLKALTRAQLLKLKGQVLRSDRLLAVVVGDIDPEEARRQFEGQFGAQAWPAVGKPPVLAKPRALKAGPRRRVTVLKAKKQAHLMLGWACPPPTDPDYPALRLVNSVLGEGMDSRLFTEVREKRGLCYTTYSGFDRRLYPGSWRVYVGTQPETLKEAEAVCRQVVAQVAKDGITADELAGAKAYAKGIFQVARQDFGTEARVIANYESWGLGAAEVDQVAARLDAVTLADCKRVAKKWLKPDQAVVAVVQP
jgi:zinc protease